MKWEQSRSEAANSSRKNVQCKMFTNCNTARLDTAIKILAAAVTEHVRSVEGRGGKKRKELGRTPPLAL
jgi:hypothetical protein